MTTTSGIPKSVAVKVIGLGGAGCNAVTRMMHENIFGVEFIVMDTNATHLASTETSRKILLGKQTVHSPGTGSDIRSGGVVTDESRYDIKQAVNGSDIVFITTGLGGCTGTDAAPLVAELARQSGALVIAFVTMPFKFEGERRAKIAQAGINNLLGKADALIIIDKEQLLGLCPKINIEEAIETVNEVVCNGVRSIMDLIMLPGRMNLEFTSIKSVMQNAGPAWISIGKSSGTNRAIDAANKALSDQLIGIPIRGATQVLLNITGGNNLTLSEVKIASETIRRAIVPDANIISDVVISPEMCDEIRITLITTGFPAMDKPVLRYGSIVTERLSGLSIGTKHLSYALREREPMYSISCSRASIMANKKTCLVV